MEITQLKALRAARREEPDPEGQITEDRVTDRHPQQVGRIEAVDAVRIVTVLTVVSVHLLSNVIPEDGRATGLFLVVFHSSREVFLLLSAFVLSYGYRTRVIRPSAFWKKRIPLVFIPYAVWTFIYFLADSHLGRPRTFAWHLIYDLATGTARYHLYFLLLTLQLYLVFPWLVAWVRRRKLPWLLASSILIEVGFAAIAHWHTSAPPPISWLANNPETWLASYQAYVIVGVVAGLNAGAVTAWCERHIPTLATLAATTAALAAGGYAFAVWHTGTNPVYASEVFQPAVVLESFAFAGFELAIAERISQHHRPRTRALLAKGADLSFGVYLLHPLLLQALLASTPLSRYLTSLPPWAAVSGLVILGAPALSLAAAVAVNAARSTPLSLAFTGRMPLVCRSQNPVLQRTASSASRPQSGSDAPSEEPRDDRGLGSGEVALRLEPPVESPRSSHLPAGIGLQTGNC